MELLDTNGPPWRPKGIDAGGGYAPSRTERGKLKYNVVSIFSTSHLNDTLGFTFSGPMEYN